MTLHMYLLISMYKWHFGMSKMEFGKSHSSSNSWVSKLHIQISNYSYTLSPGRLFRIQLSATPGLQCGAILLNSVQSVTPYPHDAWSFPYSSTRCLQKCHISHIPRSLQWHLLAPQCLKWLSTVPEVTLHRAWCDSPQCLKGYHVHSQCLKWLSSPP
jgi:hypothetical protein